MPIPPPPPPGPPPPPAFAPAKVAAPDPAGRNMLLDSIRQGKALKKVSVINDRSAPIVDANKSKSGGGNSGSVGGGSGGGGRVNGLNIPPGLGGLFAGGMPKLKPVGSSSAGLGSPSRNWSSSNNSNNITQENEQGNSNESYNNNHGGSSGNFHSTSAPPSLHLSPAKPTPPQPPPSNLKPLSYSSQQYSSSNNVASEEKRSSYGKPSLAPKPPALNGPKPVKPNPPPKLYIPPPTSSSLHGDSPSSATPGSNYSPNPPTPPPTVHRAHSMRMPKSESPTANDIVSYKTIGRVAGREMTGNRAPQPPPPPRVINGGNRPRPAILRPPSARPPPPPNKAPPNHPPPPPPANAPPPPPHRTVPAPAPPQMRINGVLGPLPPVPTTGPPPPPVRNSSMRSDNSTSSVTSVSSSCSSSPVTFIGADLEARFNQYFRSIDELPAPVPFSGLMKTYPSKNAQSQSVKRQPAPQPPTHLTQVQLGDKMWVNNSSTC